MRLLLMYGPEPYCTTSSSLDASKGGKSRGIGAANQTEGFRTKQAATVRIAYMPVYAILQVVASPSKLKRE